MDQVRTYNLTALQVAELFHAHATSNYWREMATRRNVYIWKDNGLPHVSFPGVSHRSRDDSKKRLRFNRAQVLAWWRKKQKDG